MLNQISSESNSYKCKINPSVYLYSTKILQVSKVRSALIRELHGDGDDGITAVIAEVLRLDFIMTDTAVMAGMGTAVTVVLR